ncbi:MAG: hypothetical protein M3Y59_07345 [Myxococcota bacterium]|nr:hypothetical protein [Myxococcota bacterium]
MQKASSLLPEGVERMAVVSIDVPFFVPSSMVRSRAKKHIPTKYWSDVIVDGGGIADQLQLADRKQPVAIAVSQDGRVLATASGGPDSADAAEVWASLSPTRPR